VTAGVTTALVVRCIGCVEAFTVHDERAEGGVARWDDVLEVVEGFGCPVCGCDLVIVGRDGCVV
jgi:hypothetical protein